MIDLDEVHAIVPVPDDVGRYGIVSLGQLIGSLMEGLRLEDAIKGAEIDTWDNTPEHLARVADLNHTGDASTYWDFKADDDG